MPDIKFASGESGKTYAHVPDYFEVATAAVREMFRQVGPLTLDSHGIARRGLLVRHLVLPGHVEETEEILRFIAREISPETCISLMSQYFPAYKADEFDTLSRRLTREEYQRAKTALEALHLDFGWVQEMN